MIYSTATLVPALRTGQWPPPSDAAAYDIQRERERLYIITTLRCPCACDFCLFIKTEGDIPDAPNAIMATRVREVLAGFPTTEFSIAITGGEPLMHPTRIQAILNAIQETATPDKVRWIGFGASGSTPIPRYLNQYESWPIALHLSRHHYETSRQLAVFQVAKIQQLHDYQAHLASHITLHLSCNLLHGYIDTLPEIKHYLDWATSCGITHVTFRELNEIADKTTMYKYAYIKDYQTYYESTIIRLNDLLPALEQDQAFTFLSQDIRPFIYHERWQYKDIVVTFRRVDEKQLLDYNARFSGIDEIVIHQDGLVTGCWDRTQKHLRFA